MTVELTKILFGQNMHTQFRLEHAPGKTSILELIDLREGPTSPVFETFAIKFRGPGDPILPQQIYRFEHDRIGAIDLFIVPVGRDEQGIVYEAVFNRLVEPEEATDAIRR